MSSRKSSRRQRRKKSRRTRRRHRKFLRDRPVYPDFLYPPLNDPKTGIRLFALLPGKPGDPIKAVVWHSELVSPVVEDDNGRASMAEVLAALPPGWRAYETKEGRYIFHTPGTRSWSHPNPDFDQRRLKQRAQLPPPGFEPNYEALSYAWGSTENPLPIAVAFSPSGEPSADDDAAPLDWKSLSVGRNLFHALRHLRLQDQHRVLWIDAICIDQSADAEKSDQIIRMADIFKLASRILVWLGPESKNDRSGLAISALAHVGSQIELARSGVRLFLSPTATVQSVNDAFLPYTKKEWAAVEALLSRSYFERLWILQEIDGVNDKAMAICGRSSLSWYQLLRAIPLLWHTNATPPNVRKLASGMQMFNVELSGSGISHLLDISRSRKCSDPRDKVFGILGLAPDWFALEMRPHYSKSPGIIYTHAVITYTKKNQSLGFLSDCSVVQRSPIAPNIPSWVPDFSVPEQARSLWRFSSASSHSRPHFRFSDDSKILYCCGKRLAVVQSVHEKVIPTLDPRDTKEAMRAWAPPDLLTAPYISGGSLLDAFVLMLQLGKVSERWPEERHAPALHEWRQLCLDVLNNKSALPTAELLSWGSFRINRPFVTSKDGHIGMAPVGTKPGDVICAVLGIGACIVLRPVASNGTFHVVGDAYVQGLDDGSGLLGPIPEGWSLNMAIRESIARKKSYVNVNTGEDTMEDPRLGPLPGVWKMQDHDVEKYGLKYAPFLNQDTGKKCRGDPRLTPEALQQRGIMMETFAIS